GSRAATPAALAPGARVLQTCHHSFECSLGVPGQRDGSGSVLDQPPGDQPMEGTGSPAVPGSPRTARPGALQGADRRLYLLHVLPAEPPLINRGAAGLARVRRPDALLRHGRSLDLASEALPTERAYGCSDGHFCPPSPPAT